MNPDAYHEVLSRLTHWADHSGVVGLAVVGSAAGAPISPDEWSDHDLVVVVEEGESVRLLDDLSWLPDPDRVAMCFAETELGRSIVYDDGHLIEVTVLGPSSLESLPIGAFMMLHGPEWLEGRLRSIVERTSQQHLPTPLRIDHLFRALVKELVVGLNRYGRGEIISADRRIRGEATSILVELISSLSGPDSPQRDPLDPHRRFERTQPAHAGRLHRALQAPLPGLVAEILDILDETPGDHLPDEATRSIAAVRLLLLRAARSGPAAV